MGSGEWLSKALHDLRGSTVLDLDGDLISGLVSFCELAPPPDAADYLSNIIGVEAGQHVIQEYLHRRGYVDPTNTMQASAVQAYMKPPTDSVTMQTKKPARAPAQSSKIQTLETAQPRSRSSFKGNASGAKKKKGGKAISLAEVAKGSVVFQQGKPCCCQARRHNLVSNCLSCGKIVCEQEGEGPCSFCGALVLREGSTYAGLEDVGVPLSEAEDAAEAFAKRLVDYDRNSAARTRVIDDQFDYYEIEGNSWLSAKEKGDLKKKQIEAEEVAEREKGKVVVTFDLVGRKVVMNKDEAAELETEYSIMRPPDERDSNRIKPNPTLTVQPMFVDTGPLKKPDEGKQSKRLTSGLCLEITGRVQHEDKEFQRILNGRTKDKYLAHSASGQDNAADDFECSLDYN